MKKITLTVLAFLFAFATITAQEQILLQEDFNNGFPQGWQTNPLQGNNQWFLPPFGGPSIDGTEMMYIQAQQNQQSVTELFLPQLPDADPGIDVVGLLFQFNQVAVQNSALKVVQFDDQNPNIPIELEVLQLVACDPIQPWSCFPDFPDIWVEIPNYDPNDQIVLVYEDFDQSGTDFFALDNVFILGFLGCPIGLILDTNFPPTCRDGNDAQLDVTGILGEPPYTYSLDNGPPQANGNFLTTPGPHTVTVVDAIGCFRVYNYEVPNAPGMSLQTTTFPPTCFNGNDGQINATASGGNPQYFYSLDGGPAMASGSFNTTSGAHTITVTDSDGCVQVFTANVANVPDMVLNLAHTANLLCFDDSDGTATASVTSGGTPPYQYKLNNGAFQASGTFNNLAADTYVLTVKDANNCTKTENFGIGQPIALTLNSASTDLSCFGSGDGKITITAMGGIPPYKYGVDGNGSATNANNVFDDLPMGEYFPVVEDDNGCETETGDFIDQPLQLASDTVSVTPSNGTDGAIDVETSGGNPMYVYLWSNGETTQDLEDIGPGEYWLFTTDQNNCPADTLFVTVPMITGVNDILTQEVQILGNPVKNQIRVQLSDYFNSSTNIWVSLLDLNGRLHLNSDFSINNSILSIPVTHVSSGIYLLKIVDKDGNRFIAKVFIE